MMWRLLVLLVLGIPLWSMEAGGSAEFDFGLRPPSSVFDPDDLLDKETEDRLAADLARIRRDDKADVVVVVLKDLGQAPAVHVAKRFAVAWCQGPIHAVVLHVPGRADGPWIVPGGELVEALNPDLVAKGVDGAVKRAAREPKESEKVRAGVEEASDLLRYWVGGALIRSEQITEQRANIRKDLQKHSLSWQGRFLLAALGCLAVVCILGFLAFLAFGRKPRIFGVPQVPRRLGAPYCGGNRAVISLGPPFGDSKDSGNPPMKQP